MITSLWFAWINPCAHLYSVAALIGPSLTCRKRRVKCDEARPRCGPCSKSDRDCSYGSARASQDDDAGGITPLSSHASASISGAASIQSPVAEYNPTPQPINPSLSTESPELRFNQSPSTVPTSLPSPNTASYEWYDLLAEDAINNIRRHNLGFDPSTLSRRQSPVSGVSPGSRHGEVRDDTATHDIDAWSKPWNELDAIPLKASELSLLQHFVNVMGPILDIYDPSRQFTTVVPHLSVHNAGLLKSLLAVAARHKTLHLGGSGKSVIGFDGQDPESAALKDEAIQLGQVATQYYYETLHYVSQNLLYPSYTSSREIIATAILISTYEGLSADGSYTDGGWERHLRGIFWIQRSQNNNGESLDDLARAAWWAWLRQDIWVAFRAGRRTLTIWRPTKRLMDLSEDELATRVSYITARCVDFVANEKNDEVTLRIEQGDRLLQALEDWYQILPNSFKPIYTLPTSEPGLFTPIWIHPPSFAAAIQTFHFARIVVKMNQPSPGGMSAFRQRRKFLDESVEAICGIALMQQKTDLGLAFINFQSLYAAGLCVQTSDKQQAILQLLERTLDISKFPSKTLLDDLVASWRESS